MQGLIERVADAIREAKIAHPVRKGDTRTAGYYISAGLDGFGHDPTGDKVDEIACSAARAAIAEVFAWLEEPSHVMMAAAATRRGTPTHAVSADVWRNMLAVLRREVLGE